MQTGFVWSPNHLSPSESSPQHLSPVSVASSDNSSNDPFAVSWLWASSLIGLKLSASWTEVPPSAVCVSPSKDAYIYRRTGCSRHCFQTTHACTYMHTHTKGSLRISLHLGLGLEAMTEEGLWCLPVCLQELLRRWRNKDCKAECVGAPPFWEGNKRGNTCKHSSNQEGSYNKFSVSICKDKNITLARS